MKVLRKPIHLHLKIFQGDRMNTRIVILPRVPDIMVINEKELSVGFTGFHLMSLVFFF